MAFLGGIHFWWPKIFGRMYNMFWATLAAIIVFVGFNLTFFPQFILGTKGMPRRYFDYLPQFELLNRLSSYGGILLMLGFGMIFVYLIASLFRKKDRPGDNPWGALGLEWFTSSPPPTANFAEIPKITHGPYDFDKIKPDRTYSFSR